MDQQWLKVLFCIPIQHSTRYLVFYSIDLFVNNAYVRLYQVVALNSTKGADVPSWASTHFKYWGGPPLSFFPSPASSRDCVAIIARVQRILMDPCRSNIGGVRTTVTPAALTPMCAVKNLPNQPTNQPKHPFTRACSLPAVPLLKSRRRLWQQYYSIVGLRVWTPMGAQPHTVPKISASILPYVIVLVSSFARLSWSHSAFSPRWTFLLYRILPLHPPMSLVCLDKAGVGPYTLLPL